MIVCKCLRSVCAHPAGADEELEASQGWSRLKTGLKTVPCQGGRSVYGRKGAETCSITSICDLIWITTTTFHFVNHMKTIIVDPPEAYDGMRQWFPKLNLSFPVLLMILLLLCLGL